jgi:hypothetical protein
MSRQVLPGIRGTNPLGFMAAIGLLRVCNRTAPGIRIGFLDDGSFQAFLEGFEGDVAAVVASDAGTAKGRPAWLLEYAKEEKTGTKKVADLKAPPSEFRKFVDGALEGWKDRSAQERRWPENEGEAVAYAASFGTTVATDGKGNTKPTAFHFTAGQQQFLGVVVDIAAMVTRDWVHEAVFEGGAVRSGSNLRWNPAASRNRALMATNPGKEDTGVDAPLEWLAFRSLPLFPTYPVRNRVFTTAVRGGDDDMTWPLWGTPASLGTVRSMLQLDWSSMADRAERGVFAVCTSAIRRTTEGYGNFGPASVAP